MTFPATRYSPGYALHGTRARDWYAARDKARAELAQVKARNAAILRGTE